MKEAPRMAEYDICTVCGKIMSAKVRKLHKVAEGVYVHKACYQIMVRRVIKQTKEAQKRIADKGKEEHGRKEGDGDGHGDTNDVGSGIPDREDGGAGSPAAVDGDVEGGSDDPHNIN